ncbi:cellulose biosynthesis protein BcsQ [Pseudomonas sp. 3A(2025)]
MHRADDIAKLFQNLDASTDAYLEMDTHFDYEEPPPPLRPVPVLVQQPLDVEPVSVTQHSIETPEPARTSTPAPTPETPAVRPDLLQKTGRGSARAIPAPLRSLLAEVAMARQSEAEARNNEALQQSLLRTTPPALQPRVIAVVSAKGGVGKSTLCAALTRTVALPGGRSIAVELDPQDCLRHHFDASPDVAGLASGSLRGESWNDLLLAGSGNTQVLPYGALAVGERSTLEKYLDHDPHWLARQIERMQLTARDVLVLDVACGPSRYLDQALSVANHVLVVLDTEAAGYLTLDAMERALEPLAERRQAPSCTYVVNRFDASRAFSVDMSEVLRRRLGERLTGQVRFDKNIAEALAYGADPLQALTPTAGVQDLLDLGQRLTIRLMAEQVQESHGS